MEEEDSLVDIIKEANKLVKEMTGYEMTKARKKELKNLVNGIKGKYSLSKRMAFFDLEKLSSSIGLKVEKIDTIVAKLDNDTVKVPKDADVDLQNYFLASKLAEILLEKKEGKALLTQEELIEKASQRDMAPLQKHFARKKETDYLAEEMINLPFYKKPQFKIKHMKYSFKAVLDVLGIRPDETQPEEALDDKVGDAKTDFEKRVSEQKYAVVDFYTDWCGPCKAMKPSFDAVAKEYSGKAKFDSVNLGNEGDVGKAYGIKSVPTIIIFKEGKEAVRLIGYKSKNELEEKIKEITAK